MSAAEPSDEQIAAVALVEIESPQLAITSQFFAVHRLADQAPIACVWREHGCWWVHLRLQDEPYFWVTKVEQLPDGLNATWGFSSAYAKVYLAVYSDSLSADEITDALGLKPTEVRKKGDLIGGRGPKAYQEHRWYYHSSCPEPLDFETKLTQLLADVSSRIEQYRLLRGKAEAVVQVAYYEYADSPSGWHLDKDMIAKLSALDLEVDVDLYVSGPELPE